MNGNKQIIVVCAKLFFSPSDIVVYFNCLLDLLSEAESRHDIISNIVQKIIKKLNVSRRIFEHAHVDEELPVFKIERLKEYIKREDLNRDRIIKGAISEGQR